MGVRAGEIIAPWRERPLPLMEGRARLPPFCLWWSHLERLTATA